jgi:putative oxidoreductase
MGLLILRVGIGGFLLNHGWGKVQILTAGGGDQFPDPLGLGGKVSLIMIVFAEFVCSILVMAGLLTRLAAIPVVIGMGVAAFKIHMNDPLFSSGAGASKEPALLFLIPFLALIFTGAGKFSLDGLIWPREQATPPNP